MSQTGIARVLAVTPQLESALAIAAAGWPVLPLHTPVDGACDCCKPACASPGKHPWTKNGLLDATTGADQIRSWWSIWPHANIGIAVPSGFVAVDVDGPEGIEALRARGYALPETATVETGRGHHYLYRTAERIGPKTALLPKVDLRGPGSYLVAPPSLHCSGRRYRWLREPEDGIAEVNKIKTSEDLPTIKAAMEVNDVPVVVDFVVHRDAMVWPMVPSGVSNDQIQTARGLTPVWDRED